MRSYSNWQPGVTDETGEEILALTKAIEFVLYRVTELTDVRRRVVCETGELGVIPNPLVRVELRSVRRQPMGPKLWVERKEVPNQSRVVVDVDSVPDDVHGAPELAAQEAKELDDVLRPDVPVVLEEVKVQAQPLALGTDRDGADGGDPIMATPALLDGSLSARGERSPDQRCEHEARFIEEN
jgi:hypothetical protein